MNFITKWFDEIAQYVDVRLRLMKLSLIERISGVLSYFIFAFVALFVFVAVLIFLGMGLSEVFAELTGSQIAGYFITAGLYAFLMVALMLSRKGMISSMSGVFIRILTESEDDDYPAVENKNIPKDDL